MTEHEARAPVTDWIEYERLLKAKLVPDRIRSTLALAGLYQVTHEMIKQSVFDEVRAFFLTGFNPEGYTYDEARYDADVRRRAPKGQLFRGSLLWLVAHEAITIEQADRLTEIQDHRHDLTHELIKYVIDPRFEPDVELFTDALEILRDIRTFWTSIEISIGTFDEYGEVEVEDAVPLSLVVLQQCIDAYVDGLEQLPD